MVASASANKAEKVTGVLMAKVDPKAVDQYVRKYGLRSDVPLAAKVKALSEHYRDACKDDQFGECENCQGWSDINEPECPFCGEGDEPSSAKEVAAELVPAEAPKRSEANGKGHAKKDDGPKMTRAKKALELSKAVDERASVLSEAVQGNLLPAEELDRSVAEIYRLKREGFIFYWELGDAIFRNYRDKLYLLRKDEEGKPVYDNWSQFCTRELHMTPKNSYTLMDVAANYSKEDVAKLGVSKLQLLLRVPEAQRAEMKQRAEDGIAHSKLMEEVRELASGHRAPARDGSNRGQHGRAAKLPTKLPPGKGVTVAMAIGRVKVALFGRSKKGEELRAKRLQDEPHGVLKLLNGVEQHFKVILTAKGLELVIETRREEG